jgi:hypothetical protein
MFIKFWGKLGEFWGKISVKIAFWGKLGEFWGILGQKVYFFGFYYHYLLNFIDDNILIYVSRKLNEDTFD